MFKIHGKYGHDIENPQYEESFEASDYESIADIFETADFNTPVGAPLLFCMIERVSPDA